MKVLDLVVNIYALAFFVLRGGELAYLLVEPSFWTAVASIAGVVWYLRLSFSLFIKVLLLSGVYLFDSYYYEFPKEYPLNSAAGKTFLVTGANSGVGKGLYMKSREEELSPILWLLYYFFFRLSYYIYMSICFFV